MSRPTRPRALAAPLVFLLGGLCGVSWTLALGLLARDPEVELVRRVVRLTEEEYVRDVDRGALVDDALRGMLSGLDRYSAYYGPEDIARLDRETYGEFRGIGVVFASPPSAGRILFPVPGSPAAEAGLRVGDRLLSVDGTPFPELAPGGLQTHLERTGARRIELVVEGLDGEERVAHVVPATVLDPTVRHARMLDPEAGMGYLAIVSFSHHTPEEFDAAVEALGGGLRSLVVDLRSNPGGILESAVAIANRFVDSGVLVATETREGRREMLADPSRATLGDLPLILLVDGSSASASEVLAGALQDHKAGLLVGHATYGKGTVQTLTRLGGDRAIVKLTTASYLTPGGRRIERGSEAGSGIAPDVAVDLTDEERREIHRYLASYSPPPESLEAIRAWEEERGEPLVSPPPPDRQLEVAVDVLHGDPPDVEKLE